VNTLNKQPWTNDKGWSSSLGDGMGITTPHNKKIAFTKHLTEPRTRKDSLDIRPKLRNMDMRSGTWHI
jgi:hypothetical protein